MRISDWSSDVCSSDLIGFAILLGQLVQFGQDAVGDALLDGGEDRAFLNHLPRDVERQVVAVDQPAHEAQVARQYLRLVGDEDAADIELHTHGPVRVEQAERTHGYRTQVGEGKGESVRLDLGGDRDIK